MYNNANELGGSMPMRNYGSAHVDQHILNRG
jgi:hypothetical protein